MDKMIALSLAEAKTLQEHKMANYSAQLLGRKKTADAIEEEDNSSCLRYFDQEADYKVRKIVSKVNDCFHILANEPSLGLYRMQEHVHRTIPGLIERRKELENTKKRIEGVSYDLDYSISAVDSIGNIRQFTNISEALKSAIELKNKLNQRERKEKEEQEKNSKVAQVANRSISQNEIAEGYICPICYFAHENQDALMVHWKDQHSLEGYENEVFGDIVLSPSSNETGACDEEGVGRGAGKLQTQPSEAEEALEVEICE